MEKCDADLLLEGHALLQKTQALLRLCVGSAPASSADIPDGLQQILINATEQPDFSSLQDQLKSIQDKIYKLYQKLIEEPATALKQHSGE